MRSLKILPIFSLLLSLSISLSLEASRSSDLETEENLTNTLHTMTLGDLEREEHPHLASTSRTASSSNPIGKTTKDDTPRENAAQLVLRTPKFIQMIAYFMYLEDIQGACDISQAWNTALHDENFLKAELEELWPSRPETFGMTRFQFLAYLYTRSFTLIGAGRSSYDTAIISEDGTVAHFYNHASQTTTQWYLNTLAKNHPKSIKHSGRTIALSEDGKTILRHTASTKKSILQQMSFPENIKGFGKVILWQNEGKGPNIMLPLERAYGMSFDSNVILGEQYDPLTQKLRPVLYKRGSGDESDSIVPVEGLENFPLTLIRDGKTVLGETSENGQRRAAFWRDGEITLMPEGFLWQNSFVKLKGDQLIGFQNGQLADQNGPIQALSAFNPHSKIIVNDGPVVCGRINLKDKTPHLRLNNTDHSIETALKEAGMSLTNMKNIYVDDISKNNRIIVGYTRGQPFIARLPFHIFEK